MVPDREADQNGYTGHPVSREATTAHLTAWTLVTRAFIVSAAAVVTVSLVLIIHLVTTNSDTADRIQDCTDPQGQCYQRAQQATEAAIAQINRVAIEAAACAAAGRTRTVHAITVCVANLESRNP